MTQSNTDLTADVPLEQIRGLVDERTRYESWLEALESRRSATSDHVYQRVRADYDGRLQRVLSALGAHVAPLEGAERALAGRQDELTASLSERHDELAEAELRTVVGEYSADEGARIRREKEDDIQRMDGERESVVAQLTDVRALLDRSRSDAAAASTADAAAQQEESAPSRGEAAPTPQEEAPAERPSTPAYGSQPTGGVGRPTPIISAFAPDTFAEPARGGSTPPGSAPAVSTPGGSRNTPTGGGFEDLRSMVGGAGASRDSGAQDAVSGDRSAGRSDPFGTTGETAAAPAKTLRCQECGTMNFPTEWYCERCGGELAAL